MKKPKAKKALQTQDLATSALAQNNASAAKRTLRRLLKLATSTPKLPNGKQSQDSLLKFIQEAVATKHDCACMAELARTNAVHAEVAALRQRLKAVDNALMRSSVLNQVLEGWLNQQHERLTDFKLQLKGIKAEQEAYSATPSSATSENTDTYAQRTPRSNPVALGEAKAEAKVKLIAADVTVPRKLLANARCGSQAPTIISEAIVTFAREKINANCAYVYIKYPGEAETRNDPVGYVMDLSLNSWLPGSPVALVATIRVLDTAAGRLFNLHYSQGRVYFAIGVTVVNGGPEFIIDSVRARVAELRPIARASAKLKSATRKRVQCVFTGDAPAPRYKDTCCAYCGCNIHKCNCE